MMIRILSALALGAMTSLALAQPATQTDARSEPMKLTGAQMDSVTAGKITTSTENPTGQRPPGQQGNENSNCQSCTTVAENPAGNQPPGQQP